MAPTGSSYFIEENISMTKFMEVSEMMSSKSFARYAFWVLCALAKVLGEAVEWGMEKTEVEEKATKLQD